MRHTLNINGKIISAQANETLVDAALGSGILIPHDCATGQCETCRVRVMHGAVDDANSRYGDTVLACQARVSGPTTITFEEALPVEKRTARVESLKPLSGDVVEVVMRMEEPLRFRPGQYAKLAFKGFPPREYSFSASMSGIEKPDQAVFQIKRFPGGRVSSRLGQEIAIGHRARLSGPFGSAYLREEEEGPIVLTSTGTGFAPIWALARAAVLTGRKRPMSVITGIRDPHDIYMMPALNWLDHNSEAEILLTTRHGGENTWIKRGDPDEHLPALNAEHSVHVAGNPKVVQRTQVLAARYGARCYADPFTASTGKRTLSDRFREWAPGFAKGAA